MRTQSFSYLASLAFWSAVVFVPAVFAGGWEQFHATDGNNGRASRGPDLSVYTSPRFQVGSGLGSSTFGFGNTSGPVVDEGKIFCYNAKGAVLTFRESDGSLLWSNSVASASFGSWSSPSASGGKVYMGSGEYVYCLDAESGAMRWIYHLTTMKDSGETYATVVNAAVTIADDLGLCYMHTYGSFGGGTRLHAIHTADGTAAWTLDLTGPGQGAVAYNPALRLIYTTVGTEGGWAEGRGGIAAIDALTGLLRWVSAGSFEPPCYGGIAYDAVHGRVVAAGYDFYGYSGLLVCDAVNGVTVAYSGDDVAPSGDYTPAVGGDGRIYVCGAEWQDGPYAFCFDGSTATQVWRTAANEWGTWNASVVYAEDNGSGKRVVYCPGGSKGSQSGSYGMLDADTGAVLATVSPNGGNAALDHGNLYYISNDGALVAFGAPVHVIDVTCGAYGTMWPSRDQGVEDGSSVTFSFGPEIADVIVDGVSVGAVASYTFTAVTADHTIEAVFRDPFATALVPDLTNGPYHSSAMWKDPAAVLGKPCVADKDDLWPSQGASVREISLVWPAWNKGTTNASLVGTPYASAPAAQLQNNGCGLKQGGQIVVEFAQAVSNDVRNPYGIDLLVHGNAFFTGGGFTYSNSNLEAYMLPTFGGGGTFGEPVTVSVAQYAEGPWYTYTNVFGDTLWPTQPFMWDWEAHDWSSQEMDWTKPVDPALAAAGITNISAARAISLYNGSAGGTGFDLAESGFEWIRYVKMTDPNNKQGEICGLVDVAAYLGTYRVGAVLSEYGTVAGTGTYASGESVTITARPIAGYTFDRWVALPQGAKTDGNRATFTANQNATVEAAYRPSRRTMFIVK
ncbi:MAG: PQQ-binding-like beta-propeller repeat protein [Kiritimatiellae bacterium]|jgi:outer membrane protein assembly factor BamB|nr:PQQ-binding-like beta-propeller repeat protein [Kiritimatiellia bacterium]HHU14147.1 PQQ-binding-like beta-propeller repeat protein [Lentisphaerota bacterium]HON47823.1 PQQ-binding-like beta-propeller repeat protein [Kiritimatiellia bacterium]